MVIRRRPRRVSNEPNQIDLSRMGQAAEQIQELIQPNPQADPIRLSLCTELFDRIWSDGLIRSIPRPALSVIRPRTTHQRAFSPVWLRLCRPAQKSK